MTAAASASASASAVSTVSAACSQELLPILSHALPTVISYSLPSESVVQANAEGVRILARHSSTLPERFDDKEGVGSDVDSRALAEARYGQWFLDGDIPSTGVEETELFLKRVRAPSYARKAWTDMRRTLVYLRTEVRFYNEIAPLIVESSPSMARHLPSVHHAEYDLRGLVPEDSPATDARQPSPYPEDDEELRDRLLEGRGGHILLQSLSPSHGYYQESPISLDESLSCLVAVAELHASAWENRPILRRVGNRLSSTGGSYQLRFRNPRELREMTASWDSFLRNFAGIDERTNVLEEESVARLGQRMRDMAEYVSRELSPTVDGEYATLVHGDYKAMNVFLPVDAVDKNRAAVMIDFSCAGVGYGMSDVAMHIVHANLAESLEGLGEERLVAGYLDALENAVRRRFGDSAGHEGRAYPRDVAMRHYRLACVDYLRFIMGRFWRSASPVSFEKRRGSKNTTLINRNLGAAMAFIKKVDIYLADFEEEKMRREAVATA